MEASEIYRCVADPKRLRIINLLEAGPLCVCNMQEILEVPQVKMSKQLSSMKQLGLLEARREGTWMIYNLVDPVEELITANLCCLREATCAECEQLQRDLSKREKLILKIAKIENDCPQEVCQQITCR